MPINSKFNIILPFGNCKKTFFTINDIVKIDDFNLTKNCEKRIWINSAICHILFQLFGNMIATQHMSSFNFDKIFITCPKDPRFEWEIARAWGIVDNSSTLTNHKCDSTKHCHMTSQRATQRRMKSYHKNASFQDFQSAEAISYLAIAQQHCHIWQVKEQLGVKSLYLKYLVIRLIFSCSFCHKFQNFLRKKFFGGKHIFQTLIRRT